MALPINTIKGQRYNYNNEYILEIIDDLCYKVIRATKKNSSVISNFRWTIKNTSYNKKTYTNLNGQEAE